MKRLFFVPLMLAGHNLPVLAHEAKKRNLAPPKKGSVLESKKASDIDFEVASTKLGAKAMAKNFAVSKKTSNAAKGSSITSPYQVGE